MNILVTGAWRNALRSIPDIQAAGHLVEYMQNEAGELPSHPDWVEGIIGNGIFQHHPICQFCNLRYIQLTSAGYDRVPFDYIMRNGIEIHNAGDVYAIPMVEHAVGGVLWLYRQMDFFRENQRNRVWEKKRNLSELFGKTVMIVGTGNVGRACAERFKAFGCTVVGFNRTGILSDDLSGSGSGFHGIYPADVLDHYLPECDVLVLALPLKEETRHFMNRKRLELLRENAVLVNIARGGLVDEDALVETVERIRGAVLDVFEEEPLPDSSSLWEKANVIITPHNSFAGEGNEERLRAVIMGNLGRTGL